MRAEAVEHLLAPSRLGAQPGRREEAEILPQHPVDAGEAAARILLVAPVGMAIAAGVVYEVWALVQQHLSVAGYVNPISKINSRPFTGRLPFSDWLSTVLTGFKLGGDYYLDPAVTTFEIRAWAVLVSLVLGLCGVAGIAHYRVRTPEWWLSLSLLLGCLTYPVIVQVQIYLSSSGARFFPYITSRYASSLIPLAVALLALIASRHSLRRTTAAVVVVGTAVTVAASFGLG